MVALTTAGLLVAIATRLLAHGNMAGKTLFAMVGAPGLNLPPGAADGYPRRVSAQPGKNPGDVDARNSRFPPQDFSTHA